MRELTPKEVADIQLEIMDSVHDFCEKNSLRYSLASGTLLGAVRHKGFIPWDDDLDIIMPKPDYDRFIREFNGSHPYLVCEDHSTNPDYISAFAKVLDTRTVAKGLNYIDDRCAFIDIFPICGFPEEDNVCLKDDILKTMDDIRKVGKYYKYTTSIPEKISLFLKYCLKRLSNPSPSKGFRHLDAILNRYPFETSEYVGNFVSPAGYFSERQKREVFLNYKDIQFEDRTYRSIVDTDVYLKGLYGDYMTPPPEKERVGTHFFKVYMK